MRSLHRDGMRDIFEEYMESPMWNRIRLNVILRDGGKCQKCGCLALTKGNMVHHKDYRHWGKGNVEEANDCVLMCKGFHDVEHILNKVVTPFFAKRHYAAIYCLDKVA
jgi:5-methylcytosine-specific restriction endonuclease McrA